MCQTIVRVADTSSGCWLEARCSRSHTRACHRAGSGRCRGNCSAVRPPGRGRQALRCPECGQEMVDAGCRRPRLLSADDWRGPPSPWRPGRTSDRAAGRIARAGDQRVGLRAGGACEQPARALGLHSHGCRRLRDEEGEPGGLPEAHAPPEATRSGCHQAGHVGPVVRPPMGHAAVPVPGRGSRGLSHGGRERGRQSGAREEGSCRSSRTRVRSRTKPSPRRGASRTGFRSTRSPTGT